MYHSAGSVNICVSFREVMPMVCGIQSVSCRINYKYRLFIIWTVCGLNDLMSLCMTSEYLHAWLNSGFNSACRFFLALACDLISVNFLLSG